MRGDSLGMFWQDLPKAKGPGSRAARELGPPPPIPDTGWTPPTEFPNLFDAAVLSVDTETYDPELLSSGPGWGRGPGKGHVVGVSIAAPGTRGWYFPIRHEVQREYNLELDPVRRYLKELFAQPMPKVGANLLYDYGWLSQEGMPLAGKLYDVQFAEALLDSEAPHVALENLANKYVGTGKESSLLYEWSASYYGGSATGQGQGRNIYRCPPSLVGPYAESDATLPLQILSRQWPLLQQRGVMGLFEMECGLIPLLHDMRVLGAPVDVQGAEQYDEQLGEEIAELQKRIDSIAGRPVSVNSAESMQKAFDHLGLPYGRTKLGAPSFTSAVLEGTPHGLTQTILELKQREKVRGTFVRSYILDNHVGGRVHGQFHPLRADKTGARSGRFSSSTPNLQNIPIRSDIGARVRGLFRALNRRWVSIDYSQIEYRLFAHFALGQGSDGIRQRYLDDPNTDYHQATIDLVYAATGILLPRTSAKNINFGLLYGMGKPKIIGDLGAGGLEVFNSYHTAAPFVKTTSRWCSDFAQENGYIDTILGRKSDFNLWESTDFHDDGQPLPIAQAIAAYGSVQRAMTHKALNRKLQGSAADVMKAAMWRLYHDGILDAIGTPLLTVHDELDWDDTGQGTDADWAEAIHVMQTAVKQVRVPILVSVATGRTWQDCK